MDTSQPENSDAYIVTPIPDKTRIAKSLAVASLGLVLGGGLLYGYYAEGNLWTMGWAALLIASPLLLWAWALWNKTESRVLAGVVEEVPAEKRNKRARYGLLFAAGAAVFTWVVQLASGTLASQWPIAFLFALPGAVFAFVAKYNRYRRVLTPAAQEEKLRSTIQEQTKAAEPSKWDEISEKWWIRYPFAALMLAGGLYIADSKPGNWWIALAAALVAMAMALELTMVVIGIGMIWLVVQGIASLPVSAAIIIGALIIASALKR